MALFTCLILVQERTDFGDLFSDEAPPARLIRVRYLIGQLVSSRVIATTTLTKAE